MTLRRPGARPPYSFALLVAVLAAGGSSAGDAPQNPFGRIGHIVVIVTENRSFDHVFGLFPGAEGVLSKNMRSTQVDADGAPLPGLPMPPGDDRWPKNLPNAAFSLDAYLGVDAKTPDPVHDFYQEKEQIDDGKMDRFVEASNVGGLVMGYYDGRPLQQWRLAQEFTLADHFFHGVFGGSFVNHMFLVCACVARYPEAPSEIRAVEDGRGLLARAPDSPRSAMQGPPHWAHAGRVTPDGYAVSTLAPFHPLNDRDRSDAPLRLPPQTAPTIGDRLSAKGISWAWYAGGWNDVTSGKAKPYAPPQLFQTHHQPFAYFAAYAPGAPARAAHLKDAEEFFQAAESGTLPAVSFYKPVGRDNSHPFYSDVLAGDAHLAQVIARLRASPNWRDMLVIVTADENGGFWDHVAPPRIDRFGPGARVPTLIVSPFVRKGYVDHTVYDTSSILKTIETRFGLEPLTARDAAAADLRNALEDAAGS